MQLGDPDKGSFFQANARTLQFLGVCCGLLAVFLAALLPGWGPLALVLPGTAAGWLYALASGPSARLTRRLRWVARVPGAKELFVGLAWAVTVALVPALAAGPGPSLPASVAPAALLCFLMAGQRTLLTDLLDLEADQLVGRETLAGVLGRAGCKRLALALLAAQVALLAGGAAGVLDWTRWLSSAMLLAVGYSGFCFLQFLIGKLPEGERGEILIDATFYACGLAALAGAVAR
jgi:4-hydroxybenzoate polyprenyltransferase